MIYKYTKPKAAKQANTDNGFSVGECSRYTVILFSVGCVGIHL